MRCFLCNTTLTEQIYAEHIVLKCPKCKKHYIKTQYIDSVFKTLSKFFKFKNN